MCTEREQLGLAAAGLGVFLVFVFLCLCVCVFYLNYIGFISLGPFKQCHQLTLVIVRKS